MDDAVLMVSELVTNAVLYGDAPYELVVRVDPAEAVCILVDPGAVRPTLRRTDTQAENGRGLRIVAKLSAGLHGRIPQGFATCPRRSLVTAPSVSEASEPALPPSS